MDKEICTVRQVRADEWRQVRDLRLEALRDPDAPIAFLERYDAAASRPDAFWQQRATDAAAGQGAYQVVAVAGTCRWVGSATGIVESPGTNDFEGHPVDRRQVHVVGVWLAPAYRGRGIVDLMLDDVVGWARRTEVERVRMYVHVDNHRAQGAYRRLGFVPSGHSFHGQVGHAIELVRDLAVPVVRARR